MKRLPLQRRTLMLIAVLVPLAGLFVYVALRSGPLAPVAVTVTPVELRPLRPSLFGIGTLEARYTYKIGPTFTGRLKQLDVHVGERVKAGQVLGLMDPVDLDERARALDAALQGARAQLREAEARHAFALTQAQRYEKLLALQSVSEEVGAGKRHELQVAEAGLGAARQQLARARADRQALDAQRGNLRLLAPVDGLVAARRVDPGTTVVAGQPVVELVDLNSLWINTRFDQVSAHGLQAELPARIVLRSQAGKEQPGRVLLVEPMADAVTEETLAKVVFDDLPVPAPPLGELAEVTVALPELPARPVISNASVQRLGGVISVWKVQDGELQRVPVKLGPSDLDGNVQVLEGLSRGDQVVTYSERALSERSRIHVVQHLAEASR
ncbi:MAG TPA: efflux RND transporter periplasmic adaptor subunit [Aggregicoccus sp.]|nr:efflux RND transporter periplasmic adaptor subunit [Aggregicoccus sp.]